MDVDSICSFYRGLVLQGLNSTYDLGSERKGTFFFKVAADMT